MIPREGPVKNEVHLPPYRDYKSTWTAEPHYLSEKKRFAETRQHTGGDLIYSQDLTIAESQLTSLEEFHLTCLSALPISL